MVAPITKFGYHELDFLVHKTGLILKTMVFENKIDNIVKIAAYLHLLLPPEDRDQDKVLIQLFHSCYKASINVNWMENFRNEVTRILFCTYVAGISVNIPNITWVIQ